MICGQFLRGGLVLSGLQMFKDGKPSLFYPIDRVGDASNCGQLSWHPSGHVLAAEIDGVIWFAHTDTEKLELWRPGTLPAWSPDGKWICYRPTTGGLVISTEDKMTERLLVRDVDVEGFAAWSPEGTYVAFAKASRFFFVGGGRYVCRVSDGKVALVQPPSPVKWSNRVVGWYYIDSSVAARLYKR